MESERSQAMSRLIEIELANGTYTEARTKELLLKLLDEYPLGKWRYAETVRIEDNVISHSHPVLTLNTFGIRHPLRLLSTYIHGQLHWFWTLEQHEDRTLEASRQFRDAFPDIPIDPPAGCRSEMSNYLHVAINYLELTGLGELIGEGAARAFISAKPYYTAVYDIVLREGDRIGAILNDLDLMPPDQPPADKRFVTVDDTNQDWSSCAGLTQQVATPKNPVSQASSCDAEQVSSYTAWNWGIENSPRSCSLRNERNSCSSMISIPSN